MRKTTSTLILFFACIGFISNAQDCADRKFLRKGTKLSFENRNRDGKAVGSDQQEVVNVVPANNGVQATVKITSNATNKTSTPIEYNILCNGTMLTFDVKGILNQEFLNSIGPKGMELKVLSSENIEFPVSATVGTILKDSRMEFQVSMQGNPIGTAVVYFKNRKVEGTEKITSPAGNFDCLKISSDSEIVVAFMGQNMKQYSKSISWVHENVGPVKIDSFNANGKLESSRVLTKIE